MSSLSEVLDISPIEVYTTESKSPVMLPEGAAEEDHQYARGHTYNLIEKGAEALEMAMRICRESEDPKAIQVLSGLIKNLAEVNKTLVVLNKDKNEAKVTTSQNVGTAIQANNVIFSGNSKELNAMLKEQKGN